MFKKRSIDRVLLLSLLIMCVTTPIYSQEKMDTVRMNASAVDQLITYSASDSIYSDLRKRQIHLYRDATIDNGEINMKAGYMMIDLNKKEVYATFLLDEDSNRIQLPEFTDGAEKIVASSIRYNFDTEKGYIEDMAVKQDENHLYMEIAKRHSNDEIHFRKGRFTTCDLPDPHYHFQLSKAVMIPEKRIVSGPMNLWIKGVPTPLGLPFSIIPQVEDKSKGLIFPQIVPLSQYGFGFQDLGYYLPISDRLQTTFYGSLFSRGSWGVKNTTDYAVRYKFKGTINLGFEQFMLGFPSNDRRNKLSLNWQHQKDLKSSPYWQFGSNVNFISDNNTKNNLDPLNANYFNNTLNSDINIRRLFPGKPITSGLKLSLKQNSISNNISLTSPILNVDVTRFFPFKRLTTKTNALSRFGVSYRFEGQNRSTFGDSLLSNGDFARIARQYQNGMNQSLIMQTTVSMFKNTWKLTPSINYGNIINFQQTRKTYDSVTNNFVNDTIQEFGMAHSLSFSAQLTTALYSYYKYIGKRKPILRHVLTPSFGFSYIPNLNTLITDNVGSNQSEISYSPFEQSLYRVSSTKDQALIRFGFNNTFELKTISKKDTVTGFRKIRLIDAFSINGEYDLLKDSMNLSNIRLSLRISPIPWVNFVAGSTFSPYGWDDSTGALLGSYALQTNNQLGRFMSNNFTTTITFTSKESREKIEDSRENISANWNADYEYFLLHPEQIVNFDIPWKLSLSHNYTLNLNTNPTVFQPDKWNQIQTVLINGDVSFTKRWKLVTTTNIDLKTIKVTNARFSLTRDMHCWALALNWTPIGGNKSFLFTIRSTSNLFRDAKIDLRKPPAFL